MTEENPRLKKLRSEVRGDVTVTGKSITIDGVEYLVPEDFDESVLEKELDIEKGLLGGLAGEEQAAQEAIGEVAKQEGASVASLRRGAAQALATQRGLVEGGKGLALARGTAKEAATKEAVMRSGFAKQLSEAKRQAAAAKTQRLAEEGKLLAAAKERKAGPARAQSNVSKIVVKYEGDVWTSESEYNQMATELEALAASTTNPAEAAVYNKAAAAARQQKIPTGSLL